ncbi:SDR family oxidoreductase [Myxococcota bacterium]|nr:SDR family oxidoreductase [Myxococcota bacterium]
MVRLSRLSRSIEGKVALVTGAASGMGRATAHLFADEGAQVAVTDIHFERARSVVEEIESAGGRARAWELDVSDPKCCRAVVDEVVRDFGGLDILVNNAGVSIGAAATASDEDWEPAWERALATMLTAQARLVRICFEHLSRHGEGRVVNIASTEALGASAGTGPYTAAKHGVVGLTRSLAVELGRSGVTFNCICPGPIHTGMTSAIPDDAKTKFARRRVPLRRYGDPEEVAHATLSLVLPAASYINGVTLPVDGGMTIQNT